MIQLDRPEDRCGMVVRHGHVPCGLVTPPEDDGLPPNDALQSTSALWKAASPPRMIGARN